MMIQPLNLELLNLRAQQSYPFTSASSGLDVTGAVTLANDAILSVTLPVDMSLNAASEQFHLLAYTAFGDGVLFEFGHNGALVGSVMVSTDNHTFGKSYLLSGQGVFRSSVGLIQVGRLESLPLGRYEFDVLAARLEPDCIRPQLPRVLSVSIDDNGELGPELTGNIVLAAGENTGVSYSDVDPYTYIRVDVVPGATAVAADCPCADDVTQFEEPIRSVNGVYARGGTDIRIEGVDCISVEDSGSLVVIDDDCSTPCCGNPELEAVTADLAATKQAFESMHMPVAQLTSQLDILRSRKAPRAVTLFVGDFPYYAYR